MPANSETVHEIKFWIELEGELKHIDQQLKLPEAECTLRLVFVLLCAVRVSVFTSLFVSLAVCLSAALSVLMASPAL